eukprot:scaffold700_cov560-Prasinococcus_capsulatus_cf.AAC.22
MRDGWQMVRRTRRSETRDKICDVYETVNWPPVIGLVLRVKNARAAGTRQSMVSTRLLMVAPPVMLRAAKCVSCGLSIPQASMRSRSQAAEVVGPQA